MRKMVLILMTIACFGMAGCTSKLMRTVGYAVPNDSVSPDETAIVFFRPNSPIAKAIQAPVVEANEDGKLKFVAVLSDSTKYIHRTTPGKHLYVVGGESSEMLEANMEAGKTYYVRIFISGGIFKARFSFDPVTDVVNDSFQQYWRKCRLVENTPSGERWFFSNLPSLQSKYTHALEEHNKAKSEDKKIILPEYGVATPVR